MSARIQVVDYYRFAAAAWVVLFHYYFGGIASRYTPNLDYLPGVDMFIRYGYMGVDLFFLISGFVIVQSVTGKTARQFVVGRSVRLLPTFWVAMLLTAGITVLWGAPYFGVTWPQVLANLTMMPQWFGQAPVDGVYWTLVYEIKFYALVGLFVFFRKARWLSTFMPIWAILMAIFTLRFPGYAQQIDFAGGYYLLFAAGAIIASIRTSGWTPLRIVGLLASFVGVLPMEVIKARDLGRDTATVMPPLVTVALVTLFFALLLLTVSRRVSSWTLPGATIAGALTYPLYLLHAHIGYIVLNRVGTADNQATLILGLIASMLLLSYVLHRVVEVRYKSLWYRVFDGTVGRVVGAAETGAAFARRRVLARVGAFGLRR